MYSRREGVCVCVCVRVCVCASLSVIAHQFVQQSETCLSGLARDLHHVNRSMLHAQRTKKRDDLHLVS